jgi:hypothetical protein
VLSRKVEADLLALLDEEQIDRMREIIRCIRLDELAERVSQKVVRYKLELKLNARQVEEMYPIFLADQLKKDDLFRSLRKPKGPSRASHEEIRGAMDRLKGERDSKLRPILSDEQWERFRKIEEGRFGGRDRPRPGPPPAREPCDEEARPPCDAAEGAPLQGVPSSEADPVQTLR